MCAAEKKTESREYFYSPALPVRRHLCVTFVVFNSSLEYSCVCVCVGGEAFAIREAELDAAAIDDFETKSARAQCLCLWHSTRLLLPVVCMLVLMLLPNGAILFISSTPAEQSCHLWIFVIIRCWTSMSTITRSSCHRMTIVQFGFNYCHSVSDVSSSILPRFKRSQPVSQFRNLFWPLDLPNPYATN